VLAVLPLIAFALLESELRVAVPHVAQAELAGALADADSVDWVRADRARGTITFAIDRAGEAYRVVATTNRGEVASVAIRDAGRGRVETGPLSWLVDELADVASVTRLEVDDGGRVTLVTDDGRRYAVIPGRGTNDAVEARWAAAWS
jgi:hypothetical protein